MSPARITLCKELYHLSGWNNTDLFYQHITYSDGSTGYELVNPVLQEPLHSEAYPAYDLGYLVRKFAGKGGIEVRYGDLGCAASSQLWGASAEMPEDAVCTLAITLFQNGMLRSED